MQANLYSYFIFFTFVCSLAKASSIIPRAECSCGQKGSSRIVGGQNADEKEYPWMIRLDIRNGQNAFLCGATIISDRYVLSAAHCFPNGTNASDVTVYAGDYNLSINTDEDQVVNISAIVMHENYNSKTLVNDIAVLRTAEKLKFGADIQPACLSKTDIVIGSMSTVTGWGNTADNGTTSNILKEVDLKVITNANCESMFQNGNKIIKLEPTQFCLYKKNEDSCQGDSGGPAFTKTGGKIFVAGVVSYGAKCATLPGVYTRVSKYVDWIQAKTTETICIP